MKNSLKLLRIFFLSSVLLNSLKVSSKKEQKLCHGNIEGKSAHKIYHLMSFIHPMNQRRKWKAKIVYKKPNLRLLTVIQVLLPRTKIIGRTKEKRLLLAGCLNLLLHEIEYPLQQNISWLWSSSYVVGRFMDLITETLKVANIRWWSMRFMSSAFKNLKFSQLNSN